MSPAVGTGLIALASAILGGLVQAAFTSGRERRAFRWQTNKDNYGLFLQAVAGMSQAPQGAPERIQFVQMSIEAITKILLQGSPEVITALNRHQQHDILASEESYTDFGRLTAVMRKDIGGTTMNDFIPLVRAILFEKR